MKLLNSVTNVRVVGNNISVAKADGSTNTVTVPYANRTRILTGKWIGNFTSKTIQELENRLVNELQNMNLAHGEELFFVAQPIAWYIAKAIWGEVDVIQDYGGLAVIKLKAYYSANNGSYLCEIYDDTGARYLGRFANGHFLDFEVPVKTQQRKNVANTWKLSTGNELVIDANNTSTDQVVIGNTADNYTGSGFKYIFMNGKGNKADVYVNNVYGNVQGTAKTQAVTDNSNNIATTAFVQAAIAAALKAKGL